MLCVQPQIPTVRVRHLSNNLLLTNPGKGYCWWCGGLIKTSHDPRPSRRWKYCSTFCACSANHLFTWPVMRGFVLNRDKFICQLCGRQVVDTAGYSDSAEVDHIIELVDADPDDLTVHLPENLRTVCHQCHAAKSYRRRCKRSGSDHHKQLRMIKSEVRLAPERLKGRWV